MPATIDTETLQGLLERGAQLVDVLGPSEFEEGHLPGAVNIPLARLTADAVVEALDPARPAVVYCFDYQ